MINDHTAEVVTRESFMQYLAHDDCTNAFIPQADFSKQFKRTVLSCSRASGELFPNGIEIITEQLSPLAKKAVEKIAKRCGYRVTCEDQHLQLEYLGSDGGGHYSTDYYHFLEYGLIRVWQA